MMRLPGARKAEAHAVMCAGNASVSGGDADIDGGDSWTFAMFVAFLAFIASGQVRPSAFKAPRAVPARRGLKLRLVARRSTPCRSSS
eukprot:1563159-Rhodomonas_salina.1